MMARDEALAIIEDAWLELSRRFMVQRRIGKSVTLPDLSLEEADRRSDVGRALLSRLDDIDEADVSHEIALTLRSVRFRAGTWAREADWYWLVVDPGGNGIFGLFHPTAYCGGQVINAIHGLGPAFDDYSRLLDQFVARLEGQAQRGIVMPRSQIHQARRLLRHFKTLKPHLGDAYDRVLAVFSDAYVAKAPELVGISQYPGGASVYRELVALHTTLDLLPEEVHARGTARLADIDAMMARIRAAQGFAGDHAAFVSHLDVDPRWRLQTSNEITAAFQRCLGRAERRLPDFFNVGPRATCVVQPLAAALEGSMTFGYYETPRHGHPEGRYFFNTQNLTRRAAVQIPALAFHELIPGHHLHLATQQENARLHPFRQYSLINAFNEGWAEYAATFAGELGLYEDPAERYGRLMLDAFLTCRLIVDTGLNALGWSIDQARDVMRRFSGLAEAEIESELLRYGCDTPAQALAYKLGDTVIFDLREQMRDARGVRFDLRDFHAAVLDGGAMPLRDLIWHVDYVIRHGSDDDSLVH